jgi:hypothetical protein
MLLNLPAAFAGGLFAQELAAATGQPVDPFEVVVVVGNEIRVPLDETHRAKAEQVLAAHKPSTPVDHDAEFRKAVEAATSLAQLKDALLGKAGPGAEPRQPSGR